MTTGTVIVQDALAKRLILEPNVEPDEDQLAFGLRWLNRMLESWGAEKPMLYDVREETFNTSPGVATYSTSLLALGRPVSLNYLFNRLSNVDYPCQIIDNQTWADIAFKPVNAPPSVCYFDSAYPDSFFNFYPRPDSVYECHVFVTRLLTSAITADTDVLLPPGYEDAIISNLAVVYPFGVPASPDMKLQAKNGRDLLKRANYVPLLSDLNLRRWPSPNNSFPFPYW